MKEYSAYINGKWAKAKEKFPSINPADEKPIGVFQKCSREDVKDAIDAAEDAFPKWSEIPAPKRGLILNEIAAELRKNKESLARLMTIEMGKVLLEARGDVQEAIDIFEYMAGEGRRLFGNTTKSELRDKFCMTVRRPVGVFGMISPWNFPIAIPAWKIAAALICGNTFVFKPSSDTPLCAVKLFEILDKVKVPKGVANLVTGPADVVGDEIVRNKKTLGISFTGSRDTGEWILKNAGIKKICLELGGKNAIIIMDDANLNLALDGVTWGAFGTTGQRCTAASRVIVHRNIKRKFEAELLKRIRKLKIGNGLQRNVNLGPLINKNAVEKSMRYVDIGLKEGGKLLCGGKRLKGKGFFFEPTIFTNVDIKARIAREEIFGPVLSIIEAKNIDDAIEIANSVEYGLSSSIYTGSMKNAFKAIEKIDAGLTYVNASTIGSEVHLPFGGVKKSGSTREAGIEGINEFSDVKAVYIDYSGKLQRAQID